MVRLLTAAVLAWAALEVPGYAADGDKAGWALTFQDEFSGTTLDATKWVTRYKRGEMPVNGELQGYVDDVFRLQDGILTIVGDRRPATYAGQTFQYASGVLCSVHEQQYGYFEARLRVPAGQGMWPAFWLLGTPAAPGVNEIDVQEILGNEPHRVYETLHWGTDYGAGLKSDSSNWAGPDFSAAFHVYGLEWRPDAVIWTIDGMEHKRHVGDGIPQVPMYVILNLAIGGDWPGPPDATTPFPGRYDVDYVRAYAPAADAGVAGDGGAHTDVGSTGGCGCRTGGQTPSRLGALLIALPLLARRRRPARRPLTV